jgi:hypothetical protein
MTYNELQKGDEKSLHAPSRNELCEALQKGDLKKYTLKQLENGLLQRDSWCLQTLYHLAACYGLLDKIPQELMTKDNLLLIF